jgi:chloride channel protein, CIC family
MKKKRFDDNLADFSQDKRIIVLSLMSILIGIMSTFVAYALVWLIAIITNIAFFHQYSTVFRSPYNNHLGFLVILIPVAGGLVIGLMARFGSEKIRGHGIPEALEAILFGSSKMEPKVAVLKPLSSAISIGTGGPFGAEGPIIMTGGAFGSLFAQLFHLSANERKTLLVSGAAAGMSAIFASPVAAVLLSVELLLFEWRPRSFIPVAISSAVAGGLRILLLGSGPIFPVATHISLGGEGLIISFGLGILAGLVSALLTATVYGFENLFERLPIHWMWWPAIGGLFVGIGGFLEPRVLGVGYDTIHEILKGNIVGFALFTLFVGKFIVWSLSLGSGTSGGVLAPLLMMGGALGALTSQWIPVGDSSLWAMVGMAAMMAGTMRSPLTGMIFTLELTHDLNILLPLLLGCIAAHATTVLILRRSILTEKVARRGYHINREYTVDPLSVIRVKEVMDPNPPIISSAMKVSELIDKVAKHDSEVTHRQGIFIVDENGMLAGIITRSDLLRAMRNNNNGDTTVLDAGTREVVVTYPDELLNVAVNKMAYNNIGRLPVVEHDNPGKITGYLGRSSVMAARLKYHEEEHVREKGKPLKIFSLHD